MCSTTLQQIIDCLIKKKKYIYVDKTKHNSLYPTPPLISLSFVQLPAADKSARFQCDGKSEMDSTLHRKMAVFEIFSAGKLFSLEYGVRAT